MTPADVKAGIEGDELAALRCMVAMLAQQVRRLSQYESNGTARLMLIKVADDALAMVGDEAKSASAQLNELAMGLAAAFR